MEKVKIIVNGKEYFVDKDANLLETLKSFGYYIPSLCYDERLEPYGSCRLCYVKVNGSLLPSCTTKVKDGMTIVTEDQEIIENRKTILDLVSNQISGNISKEKEISEAFDKYEIHYEPKEINKELIDESHPYIYVDMNKCIKCFRCVRACDEIQGYHVWRAWFRGSKVLIRPDGPDFGHSSCVSCGLCVDVCPTGALEDRTIIMNGWPENWISTTCPYCGVGCEIEVGTKNGKIIDIRPSKKSIVNKGNLCVKGRYAWGYVYSEDRILNPMIKENGEWKEVSWDEALSYISQKINDILERYGPKAIGVLVGARITNEEEYLAAKFARVVLKTNNVDSCARVCHEPSAQGLEDILGTGGATNTFEDLDKTKTVIVIGSNITENHPVIGVRVKKLAAEGKIKLIVIDPRRTEIAQYADIFLQLKPGTDVVLLNAIANTIISEGLIDEDFINKRVEGFEEFKQIAYNYTPEFAEQVTGVKAELIREAARLYASNKPSMIFWGLGVTEHIQGTEIVYLLIDLALITGNIGKEGTGLMPLRGKNNVQGTAIMGAHPKKLLGAVPLSDQNRFRFEKIWRQKVPEEPGLDAIEMVDAALRGELKALIIFGEDLVMSHPFRRMAEKSLANLELLVLVDMFHNETSKFANVFLPASSSFEKEGTFTNAERRIQKVNKVIEPLGNSLPDWKIVMKLAESLGFKEYFSYDSPEDIWNEIRTLWPSVYGITYERLEKQGGLPYPTPELDKEPIKILHKDKFTIGEKTKLRPVMFIPSPESASQEYPLILVTGRSLYHFNMGSMTRRTPNKVIFEEDILEINPVNANSLGIKDGDLVKVTSKYGSTTIKARISDRVPKNIVFATVHFPEQSINYVVSPNVDRITHIPEYKVTAVRIEKI